MDKALALVLFLCSSCFGQILGPIMQAPPSGGGGGFALISHCVATNTGTCTINTTGASVIVILDVTGTTTVSAPTDNQSNSYTAPAAAGFLGTNNSAQGYYVCSPTTAASHIFTGHGASNVYFVSAWSGSAASCYDTASARTQAGGSGTYAPGAITLSTTNELLVSAVINSDSGLAWTVPATGGTWTSINTSTGFGADASAYLVDTANSAINPSWTSAGTPNCGGVLMALNHL